MLAVFRICCCASCSMLLHGRKTTALSFTRSMPRSMVGWMVYVNAAAGLGDGRDEVHPACLQKCRLMIAGDVVEVDPVEAELAVGLQPLDVPLDLRGCAHARQDLDDRGVGAALVEIAWAGEVGEERRWQRTMSPLVVCRLHGAVVRRCERESDLKEQRL